MLKRSLLCAVIPGPTTKDVLSQIQNAKEADLIELRVDLFNSAQLFEILRFLQDSNSYKVILTYRQNFSQITFMEFVSALTPAYIDFEMGTSTEFIKQCQQKAPSTKSILSYHNFSEMPDLQKIYSRISVEPADYYKIVVKPSTILDTMKMLLFVKQNQSKNVIGICLGEIGQLTRILGPVYGVPINYVSVTEKDRTAEGQLTLAETLNVYNFHLRSMQSKVFALIGDPVSYSVSHLTHNQVFKQMKLDAIYVKAAVTPSEAPAFLDHAVKLAWHGISVTMPLKNCFGNEIINTLKIDSRLYSCNTDSLAAIDLLRKKMPIKNKKIFILGAGNTAEALGRALIAEGAKVLFINRTKEKAVHLANKYGAQAAGLDQFHEICDNKGYDILINCTSVGMGRPDLSPVQTDHLLPKKLVVDLVSNPQDTCLIKAANKKACLTIHGCEFFAAQAAKQMSIWLNIDEKKALHHITEALNHV